MRVSSLLGFLLDFRRIGFSVDGEDGISRRCNRSNLGDNQLIDPRDYQDVRVREWLGGMFY